MLGLSIFSLSSTNPKILLPPRKASLGHHNHTHTHHLSTDTHTLLPLTHTHALSYTYTHAHMTPTHRGIGGHVCLRASFRDHYASFPRPIPTGVVFSATSPTLHGSQLPAGQSWSPSRSTNQHSPSPCALPGVQPSHCAVPSREWDSFFFIHRCDPST